MHRASADIIGVVRASTLAPGADATLALPNGWLALLVRVRVGLLTGRYAAAGASARRG
jgi:hypothetical protein